MYEGKIQVLASEQMKSSGGGLTNYLIIGHSNAPWPAFQGWDATTPEPH